MSRAATALLLAGIVWAPAARAGNDEGIPLGDDASLAANSVAAMVSDGSSLFYNPAGLARADRDQVDLSGTATLVRFYRLPGLVTVDDGSRGDGSFTEIVSVPSAVAYVRGLGPDLKLGVGLFVPERLSSTLDVPVAGQSGTFRVTGTRSLSLYFGALGLGWRATPKLAIGASLSVVYLSSLGAATAAAGYADRLFTLAQLFPISAVGAALAVGAQWEPSPGLHIGLAVRSPIVLIAQSSSGSEVDAAATTDPPAISFQSNTSDVTTVGIKQVRPLRARLGLAWAWDASWFSVEGEIQSPLEQEVFDVRRQLTWNLRCGGLISIGPHSWLGVGAFTDRSPEGTPDGLLASRLDFYGGTVGVRLDHPHALGPSEPASSVIFSTTLALRYAYGTGEVGGVRFSAMPTGGDVGANRVVDATVHELGLHIGSTLYF